MVETPGSQSSLHRANLERVVRAVRMAGSLTQAEIARTTGLSAATVSNIVRELKESGTVQVTPTSAGGRRARAVSLSGDAGAVVGVDFGHSHLRVAVGNLAHQVLAEEAEPIDVDASAEEGFDRAEQLVHRLIATTGISPEKLIGVGLGVPGPIDVETFASALWTGRLPPVDLVIRTSGETRVSNFMLWQSAYAEFIFVDTLWPEFRARQSLEAVLEYQKRERRFGLTSAQLPK